MWMVEIERAIKDHFKTTLFYRLLTFYSLGLQIIMVFDGTKKLNKINRTVGGGSFSYVEKTIEEVNRFCSWIGIHCITAPSEGEAECARLQLKGIADYVFTGDSDALVYGATKIIRYLKTERVGTKETTDGTVTTVPHKRVGKRAGSTLTPEQEAYNKKVGILDKLVGIVDISKAASTPNGEKSAPHPDSYIMLALLTGGDHDSGVARVGLSHARRICFPATKFATPFLEIFRENKKCQTHEPANGALFNFNVSELYNIELKLDWLFNELKDNTDNELGRRMGKSLAKGSLEGFPDHKVLHYYLYNEQCSITGTTRVPENAVDVRGRTPDIYSIWTYTKTSQTTWPSKDVASFLGKLLLAWSFGSYVTKEDLVVFRTFIKVTGSYNTSKKFNGIVLSARYKVQVNHLSLIKVYLVNHLPADKLFNIDACMEEIMAQTSGGPSWCDSLESTFLEVLVLKNMMEGSEFGSSLIMDYDYNVAVKKRAKTGLSRKSTTAPTETHTAGATKRNSCAKRSQSTITSWIDKASFSATIEEPSMLHKLKLDSVIIEFADTDDDGDGDEEEVLNIIKQSSALPSIQSRPFPAFDDLCNTDDDDVEIQEVFVRKAVPAEAKSPPLSNNSRQPLPIKTLPVEDLFFSSVDANINNPLENSNKIPSFTTSRTASPSTNFTPEPSSKPQIQPPVEAKEALLSSTTSKPKSTHSSSSLRKASFSSVGSRTSESTVTNSNGIFAPVSNAEVHKAIRKPATRTTSRPRQKAIKHRSIESYFLGTSGSTEVSTLKNQTLKSSASEYLFTSNKPASKVPKAFTTTDIPVATKSRADAYFPSITKTMSLSVMSVSHSPPGCDSESAMSLIDLTSSFSRGKVDGSNEEDQALKDAFEEQLQQATRDTLNSSNFPSSGFSIDSMFSDDE